jgi:hypothetical protein
MDVDVSSAPDVIVIDRAGNATEETVWEKPDADNKQGEDVVVAADADKNADEEIAADETVFEKPEPGLDDE